MACVLDVLCLFPCAWRARSPCLPLARPCCPSPPPGRRQRGAAGGAVPPQPGGAHLLPEGRSGAPRGGLRDQPHPLRGRCGPRIQRAFAPLPPTWPVPRTRLCPAPCSRLSQREDAPAAARTSAHHPRALVSHPSSMSAGQPPAQPPPSHCAPQHERTVYQHL
jgi:hypothetical protein